MADSRVDVSVEPSTVTIRAGLATKNATPASTRCAEMSKTLNWASSMPTAITVPIVTKPARTPSTISPHVPR